MSIENEALRQYKHNDGSGFVFAYDKELIDKEIEALTTDLAEAVSAVDDLMAGNEELKAENKVLQEAVMVDIGWEERAEEAEAERDRLLQHHENIIAAASTFTKDHPAAYLRGGMDSMVAEAETALNHKEG